MKKLFRLFQLTVFHILDTLAALTGGRTHSKGLLLVRLDAIGDFIIWLDSAKEFRRLYPDRKITLCANSAWFDLAKRLPHWDEVWPIDVQRLNERPIYRFQTLRKIRQAGFKIAIQPTFSRVFLHGDAIVRASGAAQRIGSVGDLSNINLHLKSISDRWYTSLVAASQAPLMELERNAEFIRNISGQDFNAGLSVLPKFINLPDRLKISSPYFIVFPGASWNGRQWPPQYFVEVGVQLHRRYGWQAVLCGSPAERGLCQSIADAAKTPCLNFAGQTTLAELAALILGAQLVLANETSAVHLAAAVRTPAVCILGGGHFGRFMPYPDTLVGLKPLVAAHPMACFNCNWHCNQPHDPAGPVPCVSEISIELVMSRAIHAIEQSPKFSQ